MKATRKSGLRMTETILARTGGRGLETGLGDSVVPSDGVAFPIEVQATA
jgi:hypothetical protein